MPASSRQWHAWSVWKTRVLLGTYLPVFARVCAGKAHHMTFVDCFAGTADSVEIDGTAFLGSPRIALRTKPEFSHAVFFELPDNAAHLNASLRAEFPDRQFQVVGGDSNEMIGEGLSWLRDEGTARSGPQLGPVLAFLDPNGLELHWTTVEAIATWTGQKDPSDFSRQGRRPELLILFPTGPMRRTLPVGSGTNEAPIGQQAQVDRLFGNTQWRQIYGAQRDGRIQGEEAWIHYVEQYRLGLVRLGYEYTSAIEVRNTRNVVQYHMVFATCHPAGKRIMKSIQEDARTILPAMVAEEKTIRSRSGERLFEESDTDLDRYANDPNKWARFFDEPPRAFDPSRFTATPTSEQTSFNFDGS